jgi:hypothetical protein
MVSRNTWEENVRLALRLAIENFHLAAAGVHQRPRVSGRPDSREE